MPQSQGPCLFEKKWGEFAEFEATVRYREGTQGAVDCVSQTWIAGVFERTDCVFGSGAVLCGREIVRECVVGYAGPIETRLFAEALSRIDGVRWSPSTREGFDKAGERLEEDRHRGQPCVFLSSATEEWHSLQALPWQCIGSRIAGRYTTFTGIAVSVDRRPTDAPQCLPNGTLVQVKGPLSPGHVMYASL